MLVALVALFAFAPSQRFFISGTNSVIDPAALATPEAVLSRCSSDFGVQYTAYVRQPARRDLKLLDVSYYQTTKIKTVLGCRKAELDDTTKNFIRQFADDINTYTSLPLTLGQGERAEFDLPKGTLLFMTEGYHFWKLGLAIDPKDKANPIRALIILDRL